MAIDSIDIFTTPLPNRGQSQAVFRERADILVAELADRIIQLNTSISQMNLEFTGTYYDGAWSAASGSKTAPKIYSHNNSIWLLLTSVADITTQEPSASNTTYYLPIGNLPVGEAVKQTLTTTTPTWTMTDGAAAILDFQTTGGNTTINLAGEPAGANVHFAFLRTIQDDLGSGYTLSFTGATVKTEGGLGLPTMSSAANAVDDWVLYTDDNGTSYTIKKIMTDVKA